MTHDQFRSVLGKKPFTALTVHTASGEHYTANHPEAVWLEPDGTTVILKDKGAGVVMIDASLISEVKFAPKTSPK